MSFQIPPWASIVIWISLGYSMIMFNKVLLTTWGFRYPFFLTTYHCALATVLTQILAKTTKLLPAVSEGKVSMSDYLTKFVPIAFLFAYGLVAGNIAYSYISLAYIQMVKAITPVPLLLLAFAFGREKPSVAQLLIVVVVSAGVMLSSIGELRFSWIGFGLQISAVGTDCFRMMALDVLLRDIKVDSLSMLYYTAPASTVFIGLGFFLFERQSFNFDMFTFNFTLILLANGMLAFSLNLAVLFLISNTSAVVMSISGPLKDILIVVTSVIVFHSPVTLMQVVGFSISLIGLNMFRHYKSDPVAMNEYVLRIRHQLWNNTCFMFDIPWSHMPTVSPLGSPIKRGNSQGSLNNSVELQQMEERQSLILSE